MEVEDLFERKGDDAVILHVHVHPGAGRSAVVGRHGTALKIRVAAVPVGGRANEASAQLLAETFGVERTQVELVSGGTNRSKDFRLSGLDVEEFRHALERAVGGASAAPGRAGRQPHRR